MAHGDHQLTLSLECELEIEAEANFAAARMLFLGDRFVDELRGDLVNLPRVRELANTFGNTITSTLWRTVESVNVPAFGLVSQHPLEFKVDDQTPLVEHFIAQPQFRAMFPTVTGNDLYLALRTFCRGMRGPLGSGEILLRDSVGEDHIFAAECFYNGYNALTLGLHQGVRKLVVGVIG